MKIAVAIVGVLALSGCAMPVAAPATTPSPSETPGWEFCDRFGDHLTDYATFLLDVSQTGEVDADTYSDLEIYARDLERLAPADIEQDVTDYLGPFNDIKDVIKWGGSGQVNLTTDDYKAANFTLLSYCTEDVGYTADGDVG